MALPRLAARGTLVYLGVVNVGAGVLFGYDKLQAQSGGWRVSEADLCKTALAGGWLGGMMAMQMFRHKTQKKSFQEKYTKAVATNAATGGTALALATRSPAFRETFKGGARGALLYLRNIVSKLGGKSGRQGPRR